MTNQNNWKKNAKKNEPKFIENFEFIKLILIDRIKAHNNGSFFHNFANSLLREDYDFIDYNLDIDKKNEIYYESLVRQFMDSIYIGDFVKKETNTLGTAYSQPSNPELIPYVEFRYDVLVDENRPLWDELVIHELSHIIAAYYYGRPQGHSKKYKDLCNYVMRVNRKICNAKGGIKFNKYYLNKEIKRRKYKYVWICQKGHMAHISKNKSRTVHKYICRLDGTKLEELTLEEFMKADEYGMIVHNDLYYEFMNIINKRN